jgi:hypothetical protein
MNDTPYSDVREEIELHVVRTLIHGGWMILEIYRRKREVKYSDPKEFEEYPVYILGNTEGG